MADDQPIVVAKQVNTSAPASIILGVVTVILFCFVSVSQISWPTISRLL